MTTVDTRPKQAHVLREDSADALRSLFQRVYREFPFYKGVFDREGLDPRGEPLEILTRLPVLDAQGYLALQRDIFERLKGGHFLTEYTSGTTGKRKVRFTTVRDEFAEEEVCVRFFRQCGIGPGDRVVALDIDSADIYLFYGRAMNRVGVREFIFHSVPADFDHSLESVLRSNPTVIISIPSLLSRCYPKLKQLYGRLQYPALSKVVYIGETMSEALRETLTAELGVELFSFYGSTEIGSMAGECTQHEGIHLYNDNVIPTIMNPVETNDSIRGKVVWTTLHFQDQPLIKYSTRDIAVIHKGSCSCGRNYPLMKSVSRAEEWFAVYGHKFKYGAFQQALEKRFGPLEFMFIKIHSANEKDRVTFALPPDLARYESEVVQAILDTADMAYFRDMKFLDVCMTFHPIGSINRRKPRRVLDARVGATPGGAGDARSMSMQALPQNEQVRIARSKR